MRQSARHGGVFCIAECRSEIILDNVWSAGVSYGTINRGEWFGCLIKLEMK